jgi:hypothetical protein
MRYRHVCLTLLRSHFLKTVQVLDVDMSRAHGLHCRLELALAWPLSAAE